MDVVAGGTNSFVLFPAQPETDCEGNYVRFRGEGPKEFWPISAVLVPEGGYVTVSAPSNALFQYGLWVSIPNPTSPGSCIVYAIDLEILQPPSSSPPPGPGPGPCG